MLKPKGIVDIGLVTHAFHMRRAVRLFQCAGFNVVPAPTRLTNKPTPIAIDLVAKPQSLVLSALAFREWLAILKFELPLKLTKLQTKKTARHEISIENTEKRNRTGQSN
jgi:uncharacterized SAM-binding protein YcdF (DUF218 family)